jgi:cytochrome c oxidase subunit I+III
VVLWQHLFWFFGHPEVYLIFMPGLGFMSAIIPTFARRPIFGYTAMVLSLIATGFLAFGLWVHHMFATNLPDLGKSFFTAASMLIAIPTAVQIFCWLATLWTGRLNFKTPLLFVLSFFFILVLGGMTGLMLASVSLDTQVHDTYFVVAHLHYVLIGGAVFPLFGALLLLVPQVHRPHDGRAPGQAGVLADVHRLQRGLLPDAPARPAGHAAARLHLPGGWAGTTSTCCRRWAPLTLALASCCSW